VESVLVTLESTAPADSSVSIFIGYIVTTTSPEQAAAVVSALTDLTFAEMEAAISTAAEDSGVLAIFSGVIVLELYDATILEASSSSSSSSGKSTFSGFPIIIAIVIAIVLILCCLTLVIFCCRQYFGSNKQVQNHVELHNQNYNLQKNASSGFVPSSSLNAMDLRYVQRDEKI